MSHNRLNNKDLNKRMLDKQSFFLDKDTLSVKEEGNSFLINTGLDNLRISLLPLHNLNDLVEKGQNSNFIELLIDNKDINNREKEEEKKEEKQIINLSNCNSYLKQVKIHNPNLNFQYQKDFPLILNEVPLLWNMELVSELDATSREKLAQKMAYKLKHRDSLCLLSNGHWDFYSKLLVNIAECLWSFNYKTTYKSKTFQLEILIDDVEKMLPILRKEMALLESIYLCKYLGIAPSNLLYPVSYADYVVEHFKEKNLVSVHVLGEKEMREQGMGAILSVGKGSPRENQMVTMECGHGPLNFFLAGKGVTFDTGGTNLKTGHFADMKYDMLGSATVVAIMDLFSKTPDLWDKYTLVAVIGLAENQIGNGATVPSDVVRNMEGKTIEILNTDAEGRVLLSDTISYGKKYIEKKYGKKPESTFVFATLTGSIREALGTTYAGVFSNCQSLKERIVQEGYNSGDLVWPMPCDSNYDYFLQNNMADIGNIVMSYKGGGSIKGAKFIEMFIGKNMPFAYFDIAGVADNVSRLHCENCPSGYGIKLMHSFLCSDLTPIYSSCNKA